MGKLLSLLAMLILLTATPAGSAEPDFNILPDPIDRGTAGRVIVEGLEENSGLQGIFSGQPVYFFKAGAKLVGLFGADVMLSPGRYPLTLTWPGGQKELEVTVRDRSYGLRSITVPKNQVELSKTDLDRTAREKKEVEAALDTQTPDKLWAGPWQEPVGGQVTSAFGRQTKINGVLNPRPHVGTDFEAAKGTKIKAPADGRVILTGDHFFAGNSIFVDHGQGLVSMFFHLSRIEVKAGDLIKRGQIIGLSGATGRVAGPHLHYGIYLNRARLDPVAFHRLTALLPK